MPIILGGPITGNDLLELDPTGSVLQLGAGTNYEIVPEGIVVPSAPLNVLYASSVDTEGEEPVSRRFGNREITVTTEFIDSGGGLLAALQAKVAKLQREGGELKWTKYNGDVRYFDPCAADGVSPNFDVVYDLADVRRVTFTLQAKPLARGAEQDLGDNVETTLPVLIFTEASVPGEVDGLGRLVIDNDVATDQWWLIWGIETNKDYTFTDSTGSGALFYEAESRTAQGGSATAAGPAGASGAGSNVMRNTALATSYQSIMSTQASGAGAHLSHVGTFRIYARVQCPTSNTGSVSLALEWGEGDFRRFTQNSAWTITRTGSWVVPDLGLVTIPKVVAGTQRWEGRIIAKSTVLGDDIDVDCLFIVPVDAGSGVAQGVHRAPSPTSFVARDEFDQSVGALNTQVAPVGGTWVTSGTSATDFQVSGSGTVTRNAGTEAEWAGRFAIVGTTSYTDVAAHIDMSGFNTGGAFQIGFHGLILRWVDASNWLAVIWNPGANSTDYRLAFVKNIAGAKTTIANLPTLAASGSGSGIATALDVTASSAGTVSASLVVTSSDKNGTYTLDAQDAALATGGTLATGRIGFYSDRRNAAATYTFDNFRASAPPADAAVYASQSLEVRHNRVVREDSGGTLWQPPSSYIGDYLTVPPAGAEGRSVRVFVKMSRAAPEENSDSAIDDLSARLFVTPRYLT